MALILGCGTTTAIGQSYAEVNEEASHEARGPQDVRGRETRTEREAPGESDEAPATPDDDAEATPWFQWERATGDWGGARTRLENAGVTIEASLIAEWYAVLDGGVDEDSSVRAMLDINATFDLETLVGLEGGEVFIDLYWLDGNSLSEDAGDFQGASNIEADDRYEVAELWYQQYFFDDRFRLKVGKIEGNAEFGFVDAAGEFVNSSAGFSPTFLALPTFPDPSTGIVIGWSPVEQFSLTAGFMDGASTIDGVRTGTQGPATFFSDDRSDDYVWMGEANLMWDG
ncbi:MAG: carbohydrate porin, partial [Phycisphaerales bacterium]|nr:carbohydrate porin [Phycisphaerales bacterium]